MSDPQTLFERAHHLLAQTSGGDRLDAAARLLREAADRGHPGAANNLGVLLQHGRGTHADLQDARSYYARAADAGLPAAQFNLGFMYLNGLGGDQDPAIARQLFELAAAGEDTDALSHLGRMAMLGDGGAQDTEAAKAYWETGAALGDSRCAFNLGVAAAGGHGAPPDFVRAHGWFRRAEQLGNPGAAAELRKLDAVMDETERSQVMADRAGEHRSCSREHTLGASPVIRAGGKRESTGAKRLKPCFSIVPKAGASSPFAASELPASIPEFFPNTPLSGSSPGLMRATRLGRRTRLSYGMLGWRISLLKARPAAIMVGSQRQDRLSTVIRKPRRHPAVVRRERTSEA